MKALQRPARVAAVVGAVAAVGAGTVFVVGTASAAEPAKCVENVNVREEPSIDSTVVALCEAGTVVEAGEVRNGFVKLNDLGGWSAQEYISINGEKPVKATTTDEEATDAEDGTTPSSSRGRGTAADEDATTGSARGGRGTDKDAAAKDGTAKDATAGGTAKGTGTKDAAGTDPATEEDTADAADGKRSESRTNGQKDAKEGQSPAAAPQPAPKPATPGAGLIPGL